MGYSDIALWARGSLGGTEDDKDAGSFHEDDDNLRSAQHAEVLELLGEGELEGWAAWDAYGVPNPLKAVYLDDTPVKNADGSDNFKNVQVSAVWGTPHQELSSSGFRTPSAEYGVSVEVRKDRPVVRTVSDSRVTKVRVTVGIPQLSEQKADENKLTGSRVEYMIDIDNGGGFRQCFPNTLVIEGKTTAEYSRSHVVQLTGSGPWRIRLRKLSDDTSSSLISNKIYWTTYATIIERQFRYPCSAMVQIRFRAKEFSSPPSRKYLLRLLKVPVPANYVPRDLIKIGENEYGNPQGHYLTLGPGTTGGVWNGTFGPPLWTENPVWCWRALATNKRWGVGEHIDSSMMDDYALYEISKFCDELVPDGKGGVEPRFAMNLQLNTREEALKVLNIMAGAFRAISFWGPNGVMCSVDRDAPPVRLFTKANVTGGKFSFSGTARNARHNVAIVGWLDPDNMYRQDWEYVPDEDAIQRSGFVNETEVIAVGCTSRGQAHRFGRWTLLSEKLRTRVVTFQTGMEGCGVMPGEVIDLQVDVGGGRRSGGRIVSAAPAVLTLDAPVTLKVGHSYRIGVLLPDMTVKYTAVLWNGVSEESTSVVHLTSSLSLLPMPGASWILSDEAEPVSQWRVLGIKEVSDTTVEIVALQHDKAMYDLVDSGTNFVVPRPVKIDTRPSDVTGLRAELSLAKLNETTYVRRLTVSWNSSERATRYACRYKPPYENWTALSRTEPSFDIDNVQDTSYTIEVVAVNSLGQKSAPAQIVWNGTTGTLEDVTGLVCIGATGGMVDTEDFRFAWNEKPGARYRCQVLSVPEGTAPSAATTGSLVAASAPPDGCTILRDQIILTPNFTYTYAENLADTPHRTIMFRVSYMTGTGVSGRWRQLVVSNPPPAAPIITVKGGAQQVSVVAEEPPEKDVVGVAMWLSKGSPVADPPGTPGYRSPGLSHNFIGLISGTKYYVKAAYYDRFGLGTMTTDSMVIPTGTGGLISVADASLITGADGDVYPEQGQDYFVIYDEATASLVVWNSHKPGPNGTYFSGFDRPDKVLANKIDILDGFKDRATTDIQEINETLSVTTAVLTAADVQLGAQITALNTSLGQNSAAVAQEISARSQADSAIAQSVTTLSTTVGNNTASITNINQTLNGVKASWGVKLDVNGKVSGVYHYNDGQQSSFVIDADHVFCLNLSSLSANLGYCSAGAFEVTGGPVGGWGGVFSAGKTAGNTTNVGFAFMQHQNGSTWVDMKTGNSEFRMSSWGDNLIRWADAGGNTTFQLSSDGSLYARGNIEATSATVGSIRTHMINGEAVTVMRSVGASSGAALHSSSAFGFITLDETTNVSVNYSVIGHTGSVFVDGVVIASHSAAFSVVYAGPYGTQGAYFRQSQTTAGNVVMSLSAGTHSFSVVASHSEAYAYGGGLSEGNTGVPTKVSITAFAGKR